MLKVGFKQNASYSYRFHITVDGALSGGQVGVSVPLKGDMTADARWKVLSVDPDGVATVDETLSNIKSTLTGPQPGSTTQTTTNEVHLQMKVAPDGRIVETSGPLLGANVSANAPGADQFFSILPDHAVKPGDTWTRDVTRANPFGSGQITIHSDDRYTKNATLKGHQDAVIDSTTTSPVDVTLDLAKLAAALNQPPPGVSGQVHYQGNVNAKTTTWLDRSRQQVDRTISTATVDLAESLEGGIAIGTQVHFSGTETIQLDRLS
jgi:hypothetical protein